MVSGRKDGVPKMSKIPVILSTPDTNEALRYLTRHISDSRLIERIGTDVLATECDHISVVSSLQPLPGVGFDSSIDGKSGPVKLWLAERVMSYLCHGPTALVLFEDPISSPNDEFLNRQKHPPFWHHNGRIFWPVTTRVADYDYVERAMASVAGFRQIALFVESPFVADATLETRSLSPEEFEFIALSLRRIITDVYDQEGYLEWCRRES